MIDSRKSIIIIFDDREIASGEIRGLVGERQYGDIIFKRRTLFEHFRSCVPEWALKNFVRVRNEKDVAKLKSQVEDNSGAIAVCFISGRAGFGEAERISQFIERLPYAEEDFTDRLYKPLITFIANAHHLDDFWDKYIERPLHLWPKAWHSSQRLQSIQPMDLGKISDFLLFTSGSTATRHFNKVKIDEYFYTKSSSDRGKMKAEYLYYSLVPETMRPWLIESFDFQENEKTASYKMLRYYLADAALQWVHGAFNVEAFKPFVDRLVFFISQRPKKSCTREQSLTVSRDLFVNKVENRIKKFLEIEDGKRINNVLSITNGDLDISVLLKRYIDLYLQNEKFFAVESLVVGHGDPCFSNILYDQRHHLLKLIDPKGATVDSDLWTHPFYDLCKISHSALGDYDFINNGLFKNNFTDSTDLTLSIESQPPDALKPIFRERLKAAGYREDIIRLGEASLFLSMLPLHMDHPNKVIAFILRAKTILDEVS